MQKWFTIMQVCIILDPLKRLMERKWVMNVSEQIKSLISQGMTQELIEEKSKVKQYTISRLLTKTTKNPRYVDVKAIGDLYDFVVVDGKHWSIYDSKELDHV